MPRWGLGRVVFLSYHLSFLSKQLSQILRLFPASTLGGGALSALLRLVLHAGWVPSLAFVQVPVPVPAAGPTSNPFLPTPAPSPPRLIGIEHLHFLVLCCIHGCAQTRVLLPLRRRLSNSITSGAVTFNSGSSLQPPPLDAPPAQHAASSSASESASPRSHSGAFREPFRAPPLPPRRASTLASASGSPFAVNTAHASTSIHSTGIRKQPRTAPPTGSAFGAAVGCKDSYSSTSSSSIYPLSPADPAESR
ncbi:hypothetical protein B0H13DRAFT_2340243 [Mycena leptocephala]|nr:hypothetical protein B0H13DRAFT_2340243 [Mycena leptocephala]